MLQEDKDNFCNSVRAEVKAAGLMDSTDNCWDFFIDKASPPLPLHAQLHSQDPTGSPCVLVNLARNSQGKGIGELLHDACT